MFSKKWYIIKLAVVYFIAMQMIGVSIQLTSIAVWLVRYKFIGGASEFVPFLIQSFIFGIVLSLILSIFVCTIYLFDQKIDEDIQNNYTLKAAFLVVKAWYKGKFQKS